MRKTLAVVLSTLIVTACSQDAVAPAPNDALLTEAAVLAYGTMDLAYPGSQFIARLHSLPDDIKLSPEQIAQIRALLEAYVEATRADKQALAAIHQEARQARAAGASLEEVRAILVEGDPIRARLHEAERQLHWAIRALLTPAQLAWLAERPCALENVRLSEEQKTQITALVVAFEIANHDDLAAIRAAFEAARAARESGATREEVAEIIAQVRPAMLRVREAQAVLHAAVRALLTPTQLICFGRFGHH